MPPVPQPISDNFRGALWALLSTALFSVAAAMAKIAVEDYHVLQILFFRQIVVFTSSIPSIAKSYPQGLRTKNPKIQAIRLLGAFVALSCGLWAVAVLPLTTAITLGFAQVFFIALLAFKVLNEPIGQHRLVAIIIGFIGVVVVMRPGVEGFIDIHALIPIAAALGAAVAIILVRRLSQTESTATLLIYQAVFVGVLAAIPLFWLWVTPDIPGLILLFATGLVATTGQWVGIKALRLGEASVIGNIQYAQLIYAAILGYFLFSEIPDRYTVTGAIIIIGSSAYLLYRERISKQKLVKT